MPRSAAVFTEYLWLTCVLGALLALTHVRRLEALDTAGGNLCYGIYLNHFLLPTRDRVRVILVNAAVEDTGRIDTARFEIPE